MAGMNSRMGWMGIGAVAAVGASLFVGQVSKVAGAPDEKPKPAAKTEEPKKGDATAPVKLTKPWSEIASLSDDQKTKIHNIHVKALAATNEIEKQEKADIMALLSDTQKVELKEATSTKKKPAKEEKPKEEKPKDDKTPAK